MGKNRKWIKQTVFFNQDRRTEKKFSPQELRCYKKTKNIQNIMGIIFLTVMYPSTCYLENVNRIPRRKVNEKVSHIN